MVARAGLIAIDGRGLTVTTIEESDMQPSVEVPVT
jgi:riboflavin synthase alpha subunit